MTPDRALLLTPDYPPAQGGIARLLGAFVRETATTTDWRVITTTDDPAHDASDGWQVERATGGPLALGQMAGRAAGWLRKGRRPLIVCGHLHTLPAGRFAALRSGAPLSLVVYSKELVGTQTRSRALLRLGAPSRVVTISRRTGDNLTALGVHRSRIRVVSPTIAPPWRAEAPTVRTSGRGLHVVCVSRLVEGYKNFEVLIRAAAVLAESGAVEQLTLVGGGPRLAALERKVAALHAQQVVRLTGEVTDAELRDILLTAHVGVLPSRDTPGEGFEGFGLVVHELAAAGMPVLVGRAGGAVDAIDESWGILLDPDDLRAWVVTLDELAQNEPRRAAMSAAAVRWAESLDPHEAPAAMLEALMP